MTQNISSVNRMAVPLSWLTGQLSSLSTVGSVCELHPFQNYSPATYSQLLNKVIMGQHITIKLHCVIVQRLTLRSGQSKLRRRRSLQPFALEIMFGKGKETASQKCVRVCACVFVHDIPRTSALPWLLILFTEDWIHYSGSSSQSWIVVITVCQGQRLRAGKY